MLSPHGRLTGVVGVSAEEGQLRQNILMYCHC